jgi:hypothetical protein
MATTRDVIIDPPTKENPRSRLTAPGATHRPPRSTLYRAYLNSTLRAQVETAGRSSVPRPTIVVTSCTNEELTSLLADRGGNLVKARTRHKQLCRNPEFVAAIFR